MLPLPTAILALIDYFGDSLEPKEQINDVTKLVKDKKRWCNSHNVFDNIRNHHLKYIRKSNEERNIDFQFLELCVKGIHNVSNPTTPFDADSPYKMIVVALKLAELKEGKNPSDVMDLLLEK